MKMKSLLLGVLLMAGTVNTFAATNVNAKKSLSMKPPAKIEQSVYQKKVVEPLLVSSSCKVSVSYGSTNVTISITCDCSQKAACDAAYKLATVLL